MIGFKDLPLKLLANPAAKEGHLDLKPAELRCTIMGAFHRKELVVFPHFYPV